MRKSSLPSATAATPSSPPAQTTEEQSTLVTVAASGQTEPMTIGERVRTARIAANKTQQQLAGDTYSKSYISAVEHGKMTPSVQALSVLAERLGLPMAYFLGEVDADLSALAESGANFSSPPERSLLAREEAALLALSAAEGFLRQDNPDAALEQLGSSEALEQLSTLQRPRWYWLAGWAWSQKLDYPEAINFLEKGLTLAEHLRALAPLSHQGHLIELAERLRCFLGSAYSALGQPELALEHHRRSLAALNGGMIDDPDLLLRIYLALGQDYLLLANDGGAISFYDQAIKQLADAEDVTSQGAIYWDRGLSERAAGDLARARTNLVKALLAFEMQESTRLAAQMYSLFGEVLINLERYDEAEAHLQQSLEAGQRTGDAIIRGSTLSTYASLHAARRDHAKAIQQAHEVLEVVRESKDQRTEGQVHITLANAHAALEDYGAAEQELGQAIAVFLKTGDVNLIGQAHARYGTFLADRGRFQEAYEHMEAAQSASTREFPDR